MDQNKQPLQLRKCMPAATLLSGSWHITYNTTGHEWFLLTGKQSAFSKCTCQDFVALPNPDPVHLPQSCCDGLHLPPSCCDVPPCRHAPWHPFRSCHAPCLLGSLCAANVCTFRLKMLKMVMNAATLTRGNHGTTAGNPHDGHPFLILTKTSDHSLPKSFHAFDAIDRVVQMASTWQDVDHLEQSCIHMNGHTSTYPLGPNAVMHVCKSRSDFNNFPASENADAD